jgi:5-methyltetrahydropteroyltriglutamate--homocysteine methyltransferase
MARPGRKRQAPPRGGRQFAREGTVKTSTERTLTTHTGSLPKPPSVVEKLEQRDQGRLDADDLVEFEEEVRKAVAGVVGQQIEAGLDVVNDGEMNKVSYATYVKERLTGFAGAGALLRSPEHAQFPNLFVRLGVDKGLGVELSGCDGDISYQGMEAVQRDIANLREAVDGAGATDAFLGAASPGCIAVHLANVHYPSDEDYLFALADAMKTEYDAIHAAGFVLQIDCPDLAMGRHLPYSDLTFEQFRTRARMHVEALNHAVRDIPADRLRMHVCWGNYEGPHIYDTPLLDLIDIVLDAKPAAICYEAANPRHAHEWKIFEDVRLPDGKVLIPGVIDSTTNFVEHPELVCERIVKVAQLVGRERVMAGTDCGFATFTRFNWVEPEIVWMKMQAMTEGAKLATEILW